LNQAKKRRTAEEINRFPEKCEICSRSFKEHLKRHLIRVHKISEAQAMKMCAKAVIAARKEIYGGEASSKAVTRNQCRRIFGPLFDNVGFEKMLSQCLSLASVKLVDTDDEDAEDPELTPRSAPEPHPEPYVSDEESNAPPGEKTEEVSKHSLNENLF